MNGIFMDDHWSLLGGWPTPLKNDGQLVTWDDEIPNWMETIKFIFQTTNQLSIR